MLGLLIQPTTSEIHYFHLGLGFPKKKKKKHLTEESFSSVADFKGSGLKNPEQNIIHLMKNGLIIFYANRLK